MTGILTKIIELDANSMENPLYVSHRRGRNWCAVLTGKNAANMSRDFLKTVEETIDLEPVEIGSVLEIGGDYTTSGGNRHPNRRYWRVIEKNDDEMTVEVHPTAAKAMRAARLASVATTSVAA